MFNTKILAAALLLGTVGYAGAQTAQAEKESVPV